MSITDEQAKLLRAAFDPQEIGHLPKSWCRACSQSPKKVCDDHRKVTNCPECKGSHTSATTHLSYVGHAEVTDRLLSVDPAWDWQPLTMDAAGMPAFDRNGGMWIKLTIHGTTRLGYGDAPGKQGGNAVKEAIGDAIRNAAMRFGVGLDLWRKTERTEQEAAKNDPGELNPEPPRWDWQAELTAAETTGDLEAIRRLGLRARAEGLSTVAARMLAAWHRVNDARKAADEGSPEGSDEGPPEGSGDGSGIPPAEGSANGSAKGYRQGSAVGSAGPAAEGSAKGSSEGSVEMAVNGAVQGWAEQHGLMPPDDPEPPADGSVRQRRARWRKTFEQHLAAGSLNGLEADVRAAEDNNWQDFAVEAAEHYRKALLDAEGISA